MHKNHKVRRQLDGKVTNLNEVLKKRNSLSDMRTMKNNGEKIDNFKKKLNERKESAFIIFHDFSTKIVHLST